MVLAPGLGCTGTESHIVGHVGPSTSHQARLQITKMVSAMPDPCHAENLQGSQRRPEPAEIVFI